MKTSQMLPPNLKAAGVKNLLRHFPELANLVLVSFEGGSAAEAAARMGLPEELGRYVDMAVRALEREVLQEVFAALLNDGDFQKNLYRWISLSTVSSQPEAWESVVYFAKYLYWELEDHGPYSRCMDAEEFRAYLSLMSIEESRLASCLYRRHDTVSGREVVCAPRWLEAPLRAVADSVSEKPNEERDKVLRGYVRSLFWNPRGYAALRYAVFRDLPVVPLEELLGDVVPMPGVFDGRRVNPAAREALRDAIIEQEGGRVRCGTLDREFGVYRDGGVVYAPVVEAVGVKMLRRYRGAEVVALARGEFEAKRYTPYLEPLGVKIATQIDGCGSTR